MLRGHLLSLWFVLALVLTAGAPLATAAQEASPAASPAALPPLLEEWLAAFNAGDSDQLLALFTDDGLWEEPAIGLAARGPDEIRAHLERLFTAAPDIGYAVTSSVVAGDGAVVEWVVTGTYVRISPGFPPPPANPSRSGGPRSSRWRTGRSAATPSTGTPTPSWCSSGRCQPRQAAGTPTG